ncbi:MAG TPA: hypothetical protein VGI39_42110 [Polyangiaceae bacterium]
MNFLAHFWLARRDLGAREAAVGAMLPDFWRMADRRVRPSREAIVAMGGTQQGRLAEVLAGIEHHGRADAVFHRSGVFEDGERRLAGALAGVGAPRMPLFAHVAWELCLDGALVRREPALASDVARAISEADGLDEAARLHHAARTKGQPLPAPFAPRMARILEVLGAAEWLSGYARPEEVARRLDGVRVRVGLPELDAPSPARLVTVLGAALEAGDDALPALRALAISGA